MCNVKRTIHNEGVPPQAAILISRSETIIVHCKLKRLKGAIKCK